MSLTNKFEPIWKLLMEYKIETCSNTPKNLLCMLCNEIIVNARHTPCGCRFCLKCITSYLDGISRPCPVQSEDCGDGNLELQRDILLDNNANREISKLLVKCPFEGCQTENDLKLMSDHVFICDYKLVVCKKCRKNMLMKDSNKHDISECEFRLVECQFCYEHFTHHNIIEQHQNVHHDLLCDKLKAKCPNECEDKNDLLIKQHLRVCTNKPEPCPYKILGCDLNNIRKDSIDLHLIKKNYDHTKMLLNQFENLNNELSALKVDKELKDKEIMELKQIIKLNESLYEKKHNDFIWKVENFTELRDQAITNKMQYVISKPFLTDRYGYKMCLKLFTNGCDDATGKFLSVFCVIMKGKYDDLLPQPFKYNVHLTLLSCKGGVDHSRSILGGSTKTQFGITRFIEQEKLIQLYLLDSNVIYIKCSID